MPHGPNISGLTLRSSAFLAGSLLLSPLGFAQDADVPSVSTSSAADAQVEDDECRLFGTDDDRATNASTREYQLRMVRPGTHYIDIVQTGSWGEPTEVSFMGFELLDTSVDSDGEPYATVTIDDALGVCEPGEYELVVDDDLGPHARVLAVFDGIVLLELHGDLRYLRADFVRKRPVFKMSWQSSYSMPAPSSGASKSKAKRRRPRRRRK